jgi:glyoxylase-like metal-dependent hydrolase (beta-lactamase superfamily II)
MKQLADGVWLFDGFPPELVNVYLLEDVLIDSGTRFDERRILSQLKDRTITAHALTHAHPDHLGSSHAICEQLELPFWVGAEDAAAAEDMDEMVRRLAPVGLNALPAAMLPVTPILRLFVEANQGPGHKVDRRLREGDEVAGFTVLDVPGHSLGHVAYWRESDRVLIAGDVLWNFHFFGGMPGLTEPLPMSCNDPARNRESARRLAALEPELVCFGHGPPLRDPRKFADVIAGFATD